MTSIKQITTIFLSLLLISYPAFAGVYKWTDDRGKIHFSDKPHKNADEIIIKASKPSGLGTTSNQLKRQKERLLDYEKNRLKKNKRLRENRKREETIARKCRQLKNIILNYEEVDYLFTRDNSGKKIRLSGAKKQKETAILQKEYDEKCTNN